MTYYEIDYKEISDYYTHIILYILNNLSYSRIKYDYAGEDFIPTNHTEDEYKKEYLNAYGYLQRASWRLSEVDEMTDFYGEEDFFYFGMNNLSSARHRIEHYLEDTTWSIFNDLDYKRYDYLVMDFYQPIRLGKDGFEEYYDYAHDKWEHYWELHGTAQLKKYVREDCIEIRDKLTTFLDYLENTDYNVLTEHKDELKLLNDNTVMFLLSIPYVPFKNKKMEDD